MSTQVSYNQDPIFALRQSIICAVKTHDIDTLVSLVADDAVIMPPNDTTIYGRDEWRGWWEEYYQYFGIAAISESEREVTINGDFAAERSGYMAAVAPVSGGSRIRDDGRFLTIWKRQADGSWKKALDIATPRGDKKAVAFDLSGIRFPTGRYEMRIVPGMDHSLTITAGRVPAETMMVDFVLAGRREEQAAP